MTRVVLLVSTISQTVEVACSRSAIARAVTESWATVGASSVVAITRMPVGASASASAARKVASLEATTTTSTSSVVMAPAADAADAVVARSTTISNARTYPHATTRASVTFSRLAPSTPA